MNLWQCVGLSPTDGFVSFISQSGQPADLKNNGFLKITGTDWHFSGLPVTIKAASFPLISVIHDKHVERFLQSFTSANEYKASTQWILRYRLLDELAKKPLAQGHSSVQHMQLVSEMLLEIESALNQMSCSLARFGYDNESQGYELVFTLGDSKGSKDIFSLLTLLRGAIDLSSWSRGIYLDTMDVSWPQNAHMVAPELLSELFQKG